MISDYNKFKQCRSLEIVDFGDIVIRTKTPMNSYIPLISKVQLLRESYRGISGVVCFQRDEELIL